MFHFAHRHQSPDCSGGGESALHRAAKLLVEKYCSRLVFRGSCITSEHHISQQYTNSVSQQEYRYDTTKNYSADVAVFQNGVMSAIVEVCASHATTGESLESRTACVGVNNAWEVSATKILNQHADLFTTANAVEVHSLLNHKPDACSCERCPGCDEFHAGEQSECDACGREYAGWVDMCRYHTNIKNDHMFTSSAYFHLEKIPMWKRNELPVFEDMVDKRFDQKVHLFLDAFDFLSATNEFRDLPSYRQGVEFSSKRRLERMKRAFQVLTPAFKRFSQRLNGFAPNAPKKRKISDLLPEIN